MHRADIDRQVGDGTPTLYQCLCTLPHRYPGGVYSGLSFAEMEQKSVATLMHAEAEAKRGANDANM